MVDERETKSNPEDAQQKVFGHVIMHVLAEPASFSRKIFAEALEERFAGHEIIFDKDDSATDSMALMIDRQIFLVSCLPVPLPPGTLNGATNLNLLWPTAAEDLASHRAHVIVNGGGRFKDLPSHMALVTRVTEVSELLMGLTSTMGLYFCNPEAVYAPEVFLALMKEMPVGRVPIELWVRLHFYGDPKPGGELGCWTTGLFDLVGREIEFEAAPRDFSQLAVHVQGAAYLLTQGSDFKDGDTMGDLDPAGDKVDIALADKGQAVIHPVIRMRLHRGFA